MSNIPSQSKKIHFPHIRRRYLWASGALLLLLALTATYSFAFNQRALPNTKVAGVAVAGLKKAQIEAKVRQHSQDFLTTPLKLSYNLQTWEVPPQDFGFSVDLTNAISNAYKYGHNGSFWNELQDLLMAPFTSRNFDVDMIPITDKGRENLQTRVLAGIETPYVETSINLVPGVVTIKTGKPGKQLDRNDFESKLYSLFKNGGDGLTLVLKQYDPVVSVVAAEPVRARAEKILGQSWTVTAGDKSVQFTPQTVSSWLTVKTDTDSQGYATGLSLVLDDVAITKALTDLAQTVTVKPVNAGLKWENGVASITTASVNGLTVDAGQTIAKFEAALLGSVSSYAVVAVASLALPDVRPDSLADLGLKELIGTATTDYTGSPTNRKFNIDVGQKAINGSLIKNDEIFSTTGTLGPIDESTGYLPELVIKDNRTVPEAGGGLCQVSTTLFRAILNAGLPVTDRTNHAYRVGYYERGVGPGLDATVYDPNPDFKWKNDTGHAILIQSHIRDNKITFELYGTKDGRSSSISTPTILSETPVGAPIYLETDTLYKGEQKQVETAHAGAKTMVTYVVTRAGAEINRQVFKSTYKPWPAQFLVGTKDKPAGASATPGTTVAATPASTPVATPTPTPTPEVTPAVTEAPTVSP